MKKDILKDEFVEMRAQGFTLKKICEELDISKPTAVKWAKEFAEDVEIEQFNEFSKYMIGEILEHENTISYHIENFRKVATGDYGKKGFSRYSEKAFKNLSRVFKQRVIAATFAFEKKTNRILSVTFTFTKNTTVSISSKSEFYRTITFRG